ncbi:MAG TPA: ABC transporter permease subunit, partial [Gemmata sp.]|nr:ABC transporter permease subunit [Gemmata sp.]
GKAAGRALFILLTIAAGIPVLLLTTLFGGVDAGLIAAGYALTAGTAILCTAIGMSAACRAPDSRSAIIRAYGETALLIGGVLLPPFVLFSPFAMLAYYYLQFETGALQFAFGFGYPAAQVAIAAVLLIEATRGLRNTGATEGPPQSTAYPEPPRGRPMPIVFTSITEYIPLPPIDDADPVLWKERHAGRTSPLPLFLDQPVRILGGLATIVAIALFVTGAYLLLQRIAGAFDPREVDRILQRAPGPPDAAGAYLVAAGVFATGLYLLPLAIGITGCVAGERIRGTLDPLLATPLRRRRMLRSKVLAHLERGLAFACGAAIALGAGFGIDGGTRLGLAAIAEFAAGVAFVTSLAVWLSVRCSSPLLALRLCIPAVVILVGLPVVVWNAIDWGNVALQVEVFSWSAISLVVAGLVCWWGAGVAIERGG